MSGETVSMTETPPAREVPVARPRVVEEMVSGTSRASDSAARHTAARETPR